MRNNKKMSVEDRDRLLNEELMVGKLVKAGMSDYKIQQILGICESRVVTIRRKLQLENSKRKKDIETEKSKEKIEKMYKEELEGIYTIREICKRYGIGETTYRKLKYVVDVQCRKDLDSIVPEIKRLLDKGVERGKLHWYIEGLNSVNCEIILAKLVYLGEIEKHIRIRNSEKCKDDEVLKLIEQGDSIKSIEEKIGVGSMKVRKLIIKYERESGKRYNP